MRKFETCDPVLLLCLVIGGSVVWLGMSQHCAVLNQTKVQQHGQNYWAISVFIPFAWLGIRQALRQIRIRMAMEMSQSGTFVRLT